MGNRMTLLLLVLAGALGALLAAQEQLGLVDDGAIEARSPPAPATLENGPDAVEMPVSELTALTETVQRPLFNRDRRPVPESTPTPEPEAPAVAARQEPPPAVELSAIVILDGRRMALFRGAGAGATSVRAEEGEQVQGWTLSEVRSDGVTLERNGQRHEIALRTFRPPPQRAKPARRTRRAVRQQATESEAEQRDSAPVPRPRRPARGQRKRSRERSAAPG